MAKLERGRGRKGVATVLSKKPYPTPMQRCPNSARSAHAHLMRGCKGARRVHLHSTLSHDKRKRGKRRKTEGWKRRKKGWDDF